jgi:hypothetical protein
MTAGNSLSPLMSCDSIFLKTMDISGFARKNNRLKGQDMQIETQKYWSQLHGIHWIAVAQCASERQEF